MFETFNARNKYLDKLEAFSKKFNLNLGTVIKNFEHIYYNVANEDADEALDLLSDYYSTKYSEEEEIENEL